MHGIDALLAGGSGEAFRCGCTTAGYERKDEPDHEQIVIRELWIDIAEQRKFCLEGG